MEKILSFKFCRIISSASKLVTWNTWFTGGLDAMVFSSFFALSFWNALPTYGCWEVLEELFILSAPLKNIHFIYVTKWLKMDEKTYPNSKSNNVFFFSFLYCLCKQSWVSRFTICNDYQDLLYFWSGTFVRYKDFLAAKKTFIKILGKVLLKNFWMPWKLSKLLFSFIVLDWRENYQSKKC